MSGIKKKHTVIFIEAMKDAFSNLVIKLCSKYYRNLVLLYILNFQSFYNYNSKIPLRQEKSREFYCRR